MDREFSLPFMGRVAEADRPKPGGEGAAIPGAVSALPSAPTRSLRDHPPHEGEGERSVLHPFAPDPHRLRRTDGIRCGRLRPASHGRQFRRIPAGADGIGRRLRWRGRPLDAICAQGGEVQTVRRLGGAIEPPPGPAAGIGDIAMTMSSSLTCKDRIRTPPASGVTEAVSAKMAKRPTPVRTRAWSWAAVAVASKLIIVASGARLIGVFRVSLTASANRPLRRRA